MLFSPCLLLVPAYIKAATLGWSGLLALSGVYLLVSLAGLVSMVLLAHAGLTRLRWRPLERYGKAFCGAVLIVAALLGPALHPLLHDHGDGHAHHGHDHHHHDH